MDGNVAQPQKKHILLEDVEFGLGGIMLGAVFFLLFFLILNYLNILSLSSLYPNPHPHSYPNSYLQKIVSKYNKTDQSCA